MRQTPQEQPESMEFPRREFESVCFHAIGLVDQNREYLQMHLRESGDAPTRQALADMELQTARLERTLSEMMDLMALEEDPVPSRRGFDLCSVLRQAASLREEMARQAKVHLTVSCEPDTCPVLGSPEEAELMVFHLLSNALRASAPGGKIVLRLCRAEDAWQLTVTDHGCGLPGPANWQEEAADEGYVVTVTDKEGYGGDIQITVGVTKDGTVSGVSILSISETAGLGMRATEAKFQEQYVGKNTDKFYVSKDGGEGEPIDAISGATITSRAFTGAVNTAIGYCKNAF